MFNKYTNCLAIKYCKNLTILNLFRDNIAQYLQFLHSFPNIKRLQINKIQSNPLSINNSIIDQKDELKSDISDYLNIQYIPLLKFILNYQSNIQNSYFIAQKLYLISRVPKNRQKPISLILCG